MSSFSLRGKLKVEIHACRSLKNTELLGTMDPYVVAHVGDKKDEQFKSKVIKGGHLNPTFDYACIFNLDGSEDLLHINVWNERALGGDDHCGRLDVSLDSVDLSGKPRWYELKSRNNFTKVEGEISITCTFDGQGLPTGTLAFETHMAAQGIVTSSSAAAAPAPAPAPAVAPASAAAASAAAIYPYPSPQSLSPSHPQPQPQQHHQPSTSSKPQPAAVKSQKKVISLGEVLSAGVSTLIDMALEP